MQVLLLDLPAVEAIELLAQRCRAGTEGSDQQGFALTPERDSRFVDFDVFSGTQVMTFGARVSGCSRLKAGRINAQVSVDTGLRGRSSGRPQQLEYRMVQRDGRWRIADIHYPGESGFSLSSFLSSLLKGR